MNQGLAALFFLRQPAAPVEMRQAGIVGVHNRALPPHAALAAADQARGIKRASAALRTLWTEGALRPICTACQARRQIDLLPSRSVKAFEHGSYGAVYAGRQRVGGKPVQQHENHSRERRDLMAQQPSLIR